MFLNVGCYNEMAVEMALCAVSGLSLSQALVLLFIPGVGFTEALLRCSLY